MYGEWIMREATDEWNRCINIGRKNICYLRYVDDTTVLVNSEAELSQQLQRIGRIIKRPGLKIMA